MANNGQNTAPKKAAFLKAFVACQTVTHAAEAAGIHRNTHYQWMEDDPAYTKAFEEARDMAVDHLVREAVERATVGTKRFRFHNGKPIINPETKQPYVEYEKDTTLLIFLLKAFDPERFRERSEVINRNIETTEEEVSRLERQYGIDGVRERMQGSLPVPSNGNGHHKTNGNGKH